MQFVRMWCTSYLQDTQCTWSCLWRLHTFQLGRPCWACSLRQQSCLQSWRHKSLLRGNSHDAILYHMPIHCLSNKSQEYMFCTQQEFQTCRLAVWSSMLLQFRHLDQRLVKLEPCMRMCLYPFFNLAHKPEATQTQLLVCPSRLVGSYRRSLQ